MSCLEVNNFKLREKLLTFKRAQLHDERQQTLYAELMSLRKKQTVEMGEQAEQLAKTLKLLESQQELIQSLRNNNNSVDTNKKQNNNNNNNATMRQQQQQNNANKSSMILRNNQRQRHHQ